MDLAAPTLASLLALLALNTSAHAACDRGPWTGTIGAVPISLVFGDPENGGTTASARYYYRRSLKELYLRATKADPRTWEESDEDGKITGSVQLACEGDSLKGTWHSPDRRRALPVSARPAPALDAYHAEHLSDLKVDRETAQVFEGHAYGKREVSGIRSVSTIVLRGDNPASTTINAQLWHEAKQALGDALDCTGEGRMRRGLNHGYEYGWDQSPVAWNDRYVVIMTSHEYYCGGAHPFWGRYATAYDLTGGKAVDTALWLIPAYRREIDLTSPLGRLLTGRYLSVEDGETECLDKVAASGAFMHPTREGPVFRIAAGAYVYSPCMRDVTVPWEQATPFLTPEGRQAAKAFR
ncbi:hypothetical protein ACQ859_13685 [Roseateles chitinivorans]|uniref:hypothetical protein n=1 Tax=Roseateles chitinivorans TaxID=2917965 RepID=UPI003D66D804